LLVRAALQQSGRIGLGAPGGVIFQASFARLTWSTGSAVKALALGFVTRFGVQARSPGYLGRYALEQRIGQGGMGIVYRALRDGSEHPLAVKMLSGKRSPAELERFEREARLTSRLTHPNTITVYDRGRTKDGVPYYAMELLDGLTLEQLVERSGPLPAGRCIYLLLQVCAALDEAHRAGLVHRDIKPANIHACARRRPPDFVKLLDFGLVRDLTTGSDPAISGSGQVLGTPIYLSPEAITHPESVDTRADIYALGAVAYFLLCGVPPFQGGSVIEVCAHHLHTAPEAPSRRHPVPSDLEAIILWCLAKDPADRPQDVSELAQALEACIDAGTWVEADAERWWRERDTSH
jgi:serine/threonine-protein kinase